ncbi:MAG TPA: AAA-like domain-containing protein [Chthonomonadaceae bacterium]|nr:AAA-like domain-containing protein [Chthonomonadaceae bacterium]
MQAETTPYCRIELFGNLRVIHQERIITQFRLQKAGLLLAYLALSPRCTFPREELIEHFWPALELDAGRQNLSTTLSILKRDLEIPGFSNNEMLFANRQTICLCSKHVTTDVLEFDALLKRARGTAAVAERALLREQAIALYRGALLTGCYEDWALRAQSVYQGHYGEALADWAQDLERQQNWEEASIAARRAIDADPFRETAMLVLMRVLARQGHPTRAIEAFRRLQARLREEMDIEPSQELRQLVKRLQSDPDALYEPQSTAPVSEAAVYAVAGNAAPCRSARPEQPPQPSSAPALSVSAHSPEWEIFPVSTGGAVPLDSPDYIERPIDALFHAAIRRQDSIVLIKGPGSVGKTSLLARGVYQARQDGATVVLTDLQKLSAADWLTSDLFYRALAQNIADQLESEVSPASVWSETRSANANFERFVRREVLGKFSCPVVWGLDEVDRLFGVPFRDDVFALFRSWHNERALDPNGPWSRLTLAIAYATEAHLFISDLNRSPFNVGTRLTLADFTLDQAAELNGRYRSPLASAELERFFTLVGGNPYLVRRGLQEIATRSLTMDAFAAQADQAEGCYGDHLNRMFVALTHSPVLCEAVRALLQNQEEMTPESFYRLQSAGLVIRSTGQAVEFRCPIYRAYLERRL